MRGRARRARASTDSGPLQRHARDLAAVAAAAPVARPLSAAALAEGRRPTAATTLLVDHWYSHAVGHVIEALRRCQGYHACDPALRIALVLNGASPARARALRAVRRRGLRRAVHELRRAGRESPPRAPRVPARLGLRRPPPRGVDAEARSASRVFGATTRRRSSTSGRGWRSGVAGAGAAGVRPAPAAPPRAARARRGQLRRDGARRAPGDRGDAGRAAAPGASTRRRPPGSADPRRARARGSPTPSFVLVGRASATASGRTASGIAPRRGRTACSPRGPHAIDAFDRPILEQLALVEAASCLRLAAHGVRRSPRSRSRRRGSRSRAAIGTSTSSTASRSTPCCPKRIEHPAFVQGRTLPMSRGRRRRRRAADARR